MSKPYSERCHDQLSTYWDRTTRQCVPCEIQPGHEVTPNCGINDRGGVHELPTKPCRTNTFNDGTGPYCRNCSSCPSRSYIEKNCTTIADTVCSLRNTAAPVTEPTTSQHVTSVSTSASMTQTYQILTTPRVLLQNVSAAAWALPVVIFMLLVVCTWIIIRMSRKRGRCSKMCFKRRSSFTSPAFAPIVISTGNSDDLEDILNENILAAPLQAVLDNLDVLEELVILLDPDTQGIKNTKHLASHCSFPSTWITYTYSMRDSKSPLKAVLEGVTSRNPDWTVGHLAKLLRQMDRNDAVAVLSKLKPSPHVQTSF